MRRAALALTTITLVLLLASGVALAATKIGGPGPDVLKGTDNRYRLEGGGGPDSILGLGAGECFSGGTGSDTVEGGPGDETSRPAVRGVAGPHWGGSGRGSPRS